jgi:hypothetical protein
MARRETTRITIRVAAWPGGLSPRTVRRYVRGGLGGPGRPDGNGNGEPRGEDVIEEEYRKM